MATTVSDHSALLSGYSWATAGSQGLATYAYPAFITYSFPTAPAAHVHPIDSAGWQPFSGEDQDLARAALKQWADASGLVFLEVAPGNGDILFNWADFSVGPHPGVLGLADYPVLYEYSTASIPVGAIGRAGDIYLNTDERAGRLASADWRTNVLLHEIGHAVGLKHPFEERSDNDHVLAAGVDTQAQTIMSYTWPGYTATTIGPIDKAAIAAIYGGPTTKGSQVDGWGWDPALERLTLSGRETADRVVGTNVRDVMLGRDGHDTLSGMAGDDILDGGPGDDILAGGDGNDLIKPGSGADKVFGHDGRDFLDLTAATSFATVNIDLGKYTIGADSGAFSGFEIYLLGAGDDVIMGGYSSSEEVHAGAGNDLFNGLQQGDDILDGGAGFDIVDFAVTQQGVMVDLGLPNPQNIGIGSFTLTSIERVLGSIYNDTLRAGGTAAQLSGGTGADTLSGGAGDDLLSGGSGADVLDGGGGVDTADYTEKTAAVVVALNGFINATVSVGGAGEDTVRNIRNIHGGSGADILTGDGSANLFRGGAGKDTLSGGGGVDVADYGDKTAPVVAFLNGANYSVVQVGGVNEDTIREIETLHGGSASDTLAGDGADNILVGDSGADFLFSNGFAADGKMKASAGADTLYGGEGNDGLFGGDGLDALWGGAGDDGMVGGAGADVMNGEGGRDFLFGGDFSPAGAFLANSGADTLNGGDGNDGLWGFDGDDVIKGDAGDDYLDGGAGNDVMWGGDGNDFLLGQDGADAIYGFGGFDYLYGGASGDLFVFQKGDSADWILDFNPAEGDRLHFFGFGFANFGAVPLTDLSTPGHPAVQFTFSSESGTDQLTIFGVSLGQLNAANVLVA